MSRAVWCDSWHELLRILLIRTAPYAGLVLVLRVSGKGTLAQLNAFDFIVPVALSSTLVATILLNPAPRHHSGKGAAPQAPEPVRGDAGGAVQRFGRPLDGRGARRCSGLIKQLVRRPC